MPYTQKPNLFLSHATEDKAYFAEPLALELKESGYPIWYDKEALRGSNDSLLLEIGKAINNADYGITIFSKTYFTKKWTMDEVVGLYQMETATRKIII